MASENSRKPTLMMPSTPSTRATKGRGSELATAPPPPASRPTARTPRTAGCLRGCPRRPRRGNRPAAPSSNAPQPAAPRNRCARSDQTRQPKASASITNCPATAGYTACIQRCCPRQGPAMPKKACAAASSSARIIANWPISGIMLFLSCGAAAGGSSRDSPFFSDLAHRRRHVVLVVLGQHFVGDEHAAAHPGGHWRRRRSSP